MSNRLIAVMGALLVALGAFGAHALHHRVTPEALEVWKTAIFYGFVHVLAAVAVANQKRGRWARPLWMAGVGVFTGSLIILVLTGLKWLGAITPIGGVLMIAGWLSLAFHHD